MIVNLRPLQKTSGFIPDSLREEIKLGDWALGLHIRIKRISGTIGLKRIRRRETVSMPGNGLLPDLFLYTRVKLEKNHAKKFT